MFSIKKAGNYPLFIIRILSLRYARVFFNYRLFVSVFVQVVNEMDEMRFVNKVKLEKEEFEALAKAISANM